MKQIMGKFAALAVLSLAAAPVSAATIKVTSLYDGPVEVGGSGGDDDCIPFEPLCLGGGGGGGGGATNATPGLCTLREAILTAEGQTYAGSTAAGECNNQAGQDPKATAESADVIEFTDDARGTLSLAGPLPTITRPLTIRGLGPDQTIITGNPSALASVFPPATAGGTTFAESPIVTISPSLPDGAVVAFDMLTLRGTRVHYFRSDSTDANCGNTGQPACAAVEPNKAVINFAGINMDNGTSSQRKKLMLSNARLVCHRRNASGGAVSVVGRASLTADTVTFSNNVSQLGSGGAIFAGAKDNGSPEVSIVDSRFDADPARQCADAVLATYNDVNSPTVCSTNSSANVNSPCPASTVSTGVYTIYRPGNFAGAAAGVPATLTSGPIQTISTADAAASSEVDGGAIAVNALNATLGNIGSVTIDGSRFFSNSARRNGGALSMAHVARETPTLPALTITDSLFSSPDATAATGNNRAAGTGGAIAIVGNANQQTTSSLSFVSFSFNRANDDGGALSYTTQPGAPIDFSVSNARFGFNSAGGNGGAIYAEDNGVDDSGILNISKATFDKNVAAEDGGALYCGATKQGSQFTNLTLSGNTAEVGGGLFVGNRCHISINNSTIYDNTALLYGTAGQGVTGGGGIFVPASAANGRVDIRNSVLAFNKSVDSRSGDPATDDEPNRDGDNSNGPDCSAPNNNILRSAGFNFVGSLNGCPGPFQPSQTPISGSGVSSTLPGNDTHKCLNTSTGDIIGTTAVPACSAMPLNPLLRVLADNGGPDIQGARNFTHLPETSSPLINNGSSTGCRDGLGAAITDDERGFFRSGSAGRCDIGAVEVGGGQTPVIGAVSAISTTTNLQTSLRLQSFEQEVEMLRISFTAPASNNISISSLTIRPEDPEGGIAALFTSGRYGSVRGYEVTVVDADGRDLSNQLYRVSGDPEQIPAFDPNSRLLTLSFNSPFQLAAGQTAFLSVRFIFEPRLTQLAMGETAVMMAAAGGLGLVSFLGLMGAGAGRRRALLVAGALLAVVAASGCGSDNDSFDDGSRTFRISARQIVFSTEAVQNNSQSISVTGETITVLPP
jgi:predicted outer membrane repeat protein